MGLAAKLLGADKAIAVASAGYFQFHEISDYAGFSIPHGPAAIVQPGNWTAPAHELGHLYGIASSPEEYHLFPEGAPATGYWVSNKARVDSSVCIMGSDMFQSPLESLTRWIDKTDYEHLFRRFAENPADPELIIVSGFVKDDGTVELGPWFLLPDGLPTPSVPGSYGINVLNAAGEIVSQMTFPLEFTAFLEPLGAQPIDRVPFVFGLPYAPGAADVVIQMDGVTLAAINPGDKLLRDAIAAIPDVGFVAGHVQRRNALFGKVGAIENMLDAGNIMGALNKISNDLRPHIEAWILEDYETGPLELRRDEVLSTIEMVKTRIAAQ